MITGIGTPKSQSKIPRPIVVSSTFVVGQRAGQGGVPAIARLRACWITSLLDYEPAG
jgi:hypothetical protein